MLILFRVDSGRVIGSGHLIRCRNLAMEIQKYLLSMGKKVEIVFLCRQYDGNCASLFLNYSWCSISWLPIKDGYIVDLNDYSTWLGDSIENDVYQCLNLLDGRIVDLLIVDHYGIDAYWEYLFKRNGRVRRIIAIDDYRDRLHYADFYLNHSVVDNDFFVNCCGMVRMDGPDFCLLNTVFYQKRGQVSSRRDLRRIQISFGGNDPTHETVRVLQILNQMSEIRDSYHFDVLMGMNEVDQTEVNRLSLMFPKIRVFNRLVPQEELAELLVETDLVIGGGGVSLYERACLGVPSLVITVSENQKPNTFAMRNLGVIYYLGHTGQWTMAKLFYAFHVMNISIMSHKAMKLIDGHSYNRICQTVFSSMDSDRLDSDRLNDTAVVIQARMGSTRLPGKVLMKITETETMLDLVISRLKSKFMVIIATTVDSRDDPIVDYCQKNHVEVFRGSEENVLERYYQVAQLFNLKVIIRITSDCPLIDPEIVDQVYHKLVNDGNDYVSNTMTRTYPRGLDAEAMTFETLEKAYQQAQLDHEKEHATSYIYTHPSEFKIGHAVNSTGDQSQYRLTVDTQNDLEMIREIYKKLPNVMSPLSDVISVLEKYPEICEMNSEISQKYDSHQAYQEAITNQ